MRYQMPHFCSLHPVPSRTYIWDISGIGIWECVMCNFLGCLPAYVFHCEFRTRYQKASTSLWHFFATISKPKVIIVGSTHVLLYFWAYPYLLCVNYWIAGFLISRTHYSKSSYPIVRHFCKQFLLQSFIDFDFRSIYGEALETLVLKSQIAWLLRQIAPNEPLTVSILPNLLEQVLADIDLAEDWVWMSFNFGGK